MEWSNVFIFFRTDLIRQKLPDNSSENPQTLAEKVEQTVFVNSHNKVCLVFINGKGFV